MNIDPKALKAMFDSDVEIMGFAYTPWGFDRVQLFADTYEKYIEDRTQFSADHFKVNLEVYNAWMESHGTPQCGANTKSGERCKKPSGTRQSKIRRWLEDEGEMCSLHSEGWR